MVKLKEINPFINEFEIQVIQKEGVAYYQRTTNVPEDGIVTDVSALKTLQETYRFRKQGKVCIFYRVRWKEWLYSMSDAGLRLLRYVEMSLERDQDTVNLKIATVTKELGKSKPTIIKAIADLERSALIRNKSQSVYWINPFFFFNGDTIKYYEENNPSNIKIVART